MKTITAETPLVESPPSILLLGPPGQGKSTLAYQFPGLAVALCDPKTFAPAMRKAQELTKGTVMYEECLADGVTQNDLSATFDSILRFTSEAAEHKDVKVICLDSITAIDEMLMMWLTKRQSRETMERQDWIPFRMKMKELLMKIRLNGKVSIVTAHEKIIYDDKGRIAKYAPTISSKLADYFGWMFSDIWRCRKFVQEQGKSKFVVQCLPDGNSDLKNSRNMPFTIEGNPDLKFEQINKYLKLV